MHWVSQVSCLQEEFKEIHKNTKHLKTSGIQSSDLKRDIQLMEQEKQQLMAKLSFHRLMGLMSLL